jgi:endonuclease III
MRQHLALAVLAERFDGRVPSDREALGLPGVGRKTRTSSQHRLQPADIAVDTHIFGLPPHRLARKNVRGRGQAVKAVLQYRHTPPLADPAWPLCLQGAQARLPAMRDP